MKKIVILLVIAILAGGGMVAASSAPSQAQVYHYAPPPADIYAYPWVGPGTPWVYYNGDWFLNGILYYFFGPLYGWAPYYAFPPIYIVRPYDWYAPKWHAWYVARPKIVVHFHQRYPYWKNHAHTHRYDRVFFDKHHRGRDAGWYGGFQGVKPKAIREKPVPSKVTPPGRQRPEPSRVAPAKPAPGRVAPPEGRKPVPSRVAPPPAPKPVPSRVAPPPAQKPAPAPPGATAPRPQKTPPAPKPEKHGPGSPTSGHHKGEKQ